MTFFYSRNSSLGQGLEVSRGLPVTFFAHRALQVIAVASLALSFSATARAQAPPPVRLSPSPSYTFPDQAAGTTSAPKDITLTNNQAVALSVSNVQVGAPFSQTNTCGSPVAAGGTCTITVTFSPTSVAFSTTSLVVTDDASNSPQSITISGNAFSPLTVTPKAGLSFSSEIVGRTTPPQTLTVTNNQSAAIAISSITSSASDFAATNNCGGTVAGNSTCAISVTFTPQAAGFRIGTVTVTYAAFGSPTVLNVSGSGIIGDSGVSVVVTPFTSCALPSQVEQFTAIVAHAGNTAVNWLVDNIPNGSTDVGTISSGGLYTAPATLGNHTIKAISQADTTAFGQGTITVTTRPSLGIFPFSASVLVSTNQTFQAQICSVPDNAVTFSVDGIDGGNSAVGTVTSAGVYTAPAQAGHHAVRATDPSLNLSSGAIATIYSNVSVDFGVRKNPVHPVPADLFGANHADDLHNATDLTLLAGAVSSTRTLAQIPLVYATQTPDWTKIDGRIASLLAAGLRPTLQLVSTPPFLQPSPNPCGAGNSNVPPSDFNQWGQIAASYVAHMDANFHDASGKPFIQDYEIWNEPNTGALCGSNLSDYLGIYAAAAPLMRTQAANDGATIRIGGPAVSGLDVAFISGLLSDARTAGNVDFISYHQYLFASSGIEANFDTYNGIKSVYQRLQESGDGAAAYFTRANTLAALNGHANTPIYVDEFNINNARLAECCRNDATFSPVYNGLNAIDLLNTAYTGAPQLPGKLTYFAANSFPYLCLIGIPDSFADCQYPNGTAPQPYPQYFLYQLLTSPSFLGLRDGGFLAPVATPQVSGGGLAVSGFYTATQNAIFIVNPTANSYPQINVEAQNTGFTSANGTLYQIVNGQSISQAAQPLTISPGETTYTATIAVPPYSVLALGIQGTPDTNPKSVQIIVSADPEPSLYPSPFTVSAAVSPLNGGSNTPTGTIAFSVDGISIGSASLSTGTPSVVETSVISPGTHVITAAYSGDANFNPATFSGTHVVATIATATTLQGNPNPASFGTPVVFTANVTAQGAPAIGSVTFDDGTAVLGSVALDGAGNATLTTSALTVGNHTITAIYTGAAQFASSSASIIEVIGPAVIVPTTTALTSSLNPAPFGQSVTFTATVAAGATPAVGPVSFTDGATALGTVTLDATGVATFATSTLSAGSHTITASYAGNAQFGASSASINQVINPIASAITLTSSLNPSRSGDNVTFTATVTSAGGAPTGTVNFLDGGAALGLGTLSPQGIATFSTSTLSVGTHAITAAYQGAPAFNPSTSTPLSQVVQALPPDFSLQISPTLITAFRGINATYGVTLTSVNSFTGVVTFTCTVGGAPQTTCSFNPPTLTGSGNTILSVRTGFAHAQNRTSQSTLVMAGLLCCLLIRRKKWQSTAFLLLVLLAGISGLSGCGANGNLGTTPGTYTITVTGTSASGGTPLTHTVTALLKVQ